MIKQSIIIGFAATVINLSSFAFGVQVAAEPSGALAFWRMDNIVKRGSEIFVSDDIEGKSRRTFNLELDVQPVSSDSPSVKLGIPELTSGNGGAAGEALVFNQDFAYVRNIWQGYNSVVIDFWMKIPELPKTSGAPVVYLFHTGAWDLTILSNNQLQWAARRSDGTSVGYLRQDLSGLENEWIHVIATFEADLTMRLMVNETSLSMLAKEMWWLRNNDNIQIGYMTGTPVNRAFAGMLDEVKIAFPPKIDSKDKTVRVTDWGGTVFLDNGILRLEFEKTTARIVSMKKEGQELMRIPGGSGTRGTGQSYHQRIAYDHENPPAHPHLAFTLPKYCSFRIIRNTPELVEISFVEDQPDFFPFYFDSRYVLKAGESGFYNYVIIEYQPEKVARACLSQVNLALRLDSEIFTVEQVSDERWYVSPLPKDIAAGKNVGDATWELLPDSAYAKNYGPVYSKYNMVVQYEDHRIHGVCSEKKGYGVWFITPSAEYINGGPASIELTSAQHSDPTMFVLGNYQDIHFGTERVFCDAEKGAWRKIYGPQFVYVNVGAGRETLWQDAKTEAQKHYTQWPYNWMTEPAYENERGSISGKLVIADGTSASNALVLLAAPAAPDSHWQLQGEQYMFWTRADADGNFSIHNVKSGEYTLYASAVNVLDEFVHDGIKVSAGENVQVGSLEWTPVRYGETAWQIGIADWDSTEFRSGDDFRHYGTIIRDRFIKDFPTGVDFNPGTDDWTKDWNYCQLHVPDNPQMDTWRIRFNADRAYEGVAHLRFSIAGSRYAALDIRLNGQDIGALTNLNGLRPHAGQGYPRSGSRGFHETADIAFDAALLLQGENVFELILSGAGEYFQTMNIDPSAPASAGDTFRSIHYDCIRLELPFDNN